MSVANQRTIIIRTPKVEKNFLQVGLDDFQQASKTLTAKQLIVYLDLCANKNNYAYEFSPAYYKNNYGMSKETAQDAFKALENAGYITTEDGKYYFNRKPVVKEEEEEKVQENFPQGIEKISIGVQENFPQGIEKISIEIDNIDIIDNIDKEENLSDKSDKFSTVGSFDNPIEASKEWLAERYNHLSPLANGRFMYDGKIYIVAETANNLSKTDKLN